MAFQTKPEDLVIAAVSAKEPTVILNNVIGSAEGVIKRALAKERRLLAFVSGYSISGTKKQKKNAKKRRKSAKKQKKNTKKRSRSRRKNAKS